VDRGGKHSFLVLEVPEQYGGSAPADYRYNAVLFEELAKVNVALPSAFSIRAAIVPPYLVHLTTEEQRKHRTLDSARSGVEPMR
jgi:alkylation response protein AidB-like acyl-CoA dehydrogenase